MPGNINLSVGNGDVDFAHGLKALADAGYDGPGWYYWDEEYPEEGSVGAFDTREECEAHARDEGGYRTRTESGGT